MSSKSGFWKSLVSFGKTALSHVNLSFDGASRTFHIDIAPQAQIKPPQVVIPASPPAQIAVPEVAPATQSAPAEACQ